MRWNRAGFAAVLLLSGALVGCHHTQSVATSHAEDQTRREQYVAAHPECRHRDAMMRGALELGMTRDEVACLMPDRHHIDDASDGSSTWDYKNTCVVHFDRAGVTSWTMQSTSR